jgi:hypothetical protein
MRAKPVFLFAIFLLLAACEPNIPFDEKVFVLSKYDDQSVFMEELALIAKDRGFEVEVGSNVDGDGNSFYAFKAIDETYILWAQSAFVSSRNSPDCENRGQTYPDPAQYSLSIGRREKVDVAKSVETLSAISLELESRGHTVVKEKVPCSSFLLKNSAG